MKIYEALNIRKADKLVISLVGGGGKTTSMNKMAEEFKSLGARVLVTTSTMLLYREHRACDHFILGELDKDYRPEPGSISLLGKALVDSPLGEKLLGLDLAEIEEIYRRNIFDLILIEADGAKLKPIKAPADHEPLVPEFSHISIGLIGLDSLGKEINEDHVHRPERLLSLLDREPGHFIEEEDLVKLALDDRGLFKGTYGTRVLLLNKADNKERLEIGRRIGKELVQRGLDQVFVTNIIENRIEKI